MNEFYDPSTRQWVTSKHQIKEIEKRYNKVFASDKELDQECEKNFKRNQKEAEERFQKKMEAEIHRALRIGHY